MAKIIIIGGGIAGCTTAIELRKQGYETVILERDNDVLCRTSAKTPGRMGLGYHYFDCKTAIFYMRNTIGFIRQYPDCFLGDEESFYLRNGRYFITKDSLVSLQEIMSSYEQISSCFKALCKNDPSNDIFQTYHLHRALNPSEFQDDVDVKKVAYAIETRELLLDWEKFRLRLRKEVLDSGALIRNNFEVDDVKITNDRKFVLCSKRGEKEKSDYVVNCTWQNADKINEKLGIGSARFKKNDPNQSVTSRLKILAEVELPEALKRKHSMFFCVGPHAMFSNMGNGIGRITYAPITNFGVTTESEMPQEFEKWLNQKISAEEEFFYGQKIIEGVSEYIPAMRQAKLLRTMSGIVKSKGSVGIRDRDSPFHKRDYDGVEEQMTGWIDNSAMKLSYSLANAKRVAEIISGYTHSS